MSTDWLAQPRPPAPMAPMSGGTGAVWADGRHGGRSSVESVTPVPVPPPPPTWPRTSSLQLCGLPTAVACGRLHAKQVLWEWQLDDLVDDAQALVSELLTNAIQASWSAEWGAGLVTLRLLASHQQLLIEVWDHSPDDPRPTRPGLLDEHGRGYLLIDALSNRWGHRRVTAGLKVVWCELLVGRR